jgi:hypothetical protein
MPAPPVSPEWADLPDAQLLDLRLCDLPIRIEGSILEARIGELRRELGGRGLDLPLHFYLAEEWFTPDGASAMAVPFYLAHPRLEKLEEAQMLEVEGGEYEWCMRILRHEAGHLVDNMFGLRRRRHRREIFGPSSTPYPEFYAPKPYSKSFVLHLDAWYAQSHPDEDFAETFAVWLTPRSNWKQAYENWPALKKLEYVERVMRRIRSRKPNILTGRLDLAYHEKTYKLIEYYGEKIDDFKDNALGLYDNELKRIFPVMTNGSQQRILAKDLIRKTRRFLIQTIAGWTGAREKVVTPVIVKFFRRCRDLELYLPEEEESFRLASLTALTTTVVMNYLHTGRYIPD